MCFTNLRFRDIRQPKGSHLFSGLTFVLLGLGLVVFGGCGKKAGVDGNQAEKRRVALSVGVVQPNQSSKDDVVQIRSDIEGIEVVQPTLAEPVGKSDLVRGLTQVLNSTPLESEQKDSLRSQMDEADDLLYNAKQQNRAAMREAFRQNRIRGATSPNIVMIVADDLALSDLSCSGPSEIHTPNLDRLARSGTRFTQAYAASPTSQDARWCLVAGRRPDQATTHYNNAAALQPGDITVAEVMWQAGYATAVFGHWGVMGGTGPAEPAGNGYDQWLGTFGPADEPQPFPEFVFQSGNRLRLIKNVEGKKGQFAQEFFVSEATEFLVRSSPRRPVFLQLFFSVPGPRTVLPERDPYLNQYTSKDWPEAIKIRAAAITRMDGDIGKLLQRLQEIRQLSNTIFIVTSDTAGDHVAESAASGAGEIILRGHRGDLYEGGLRVPLIISGTAAIPALQSPGVAVAWDIPPTIYQLASVAKIPQRKQGLSLLTLLKPNAPTAERFLKWELNPGSGGLAVRWKDWKAVRHSASSPLELYNLKTDPTESKNIAAEQPSVIAEILAKLRPQDRKVAGARESH
jgi:arylsulfatase A